jgi:hypothetical protein
MVIGTIAYNVHSGLGHLAKSFFDHGLVHRVLIVPHPHYPHYPSWYPPEIRYDKQSARGFLDGLDILLLFENALADTWYIVKEAKEKGTRIVLMPNYEYSPFPPPVTPDLVLCPSLLDVEYYEDYKHLYLPVPVDTPWNERNRAHLFIHNAGHGGHDYREGTPELLAAMKHVKNDIRLIIRAQPSSAQMVQLLKRGFPDKRVTIELGEVHDNASLWREGDVMIAPQRYNGLSLPLQEAYAAGMLVMTTNRFPMNTWLPNDPLIPVLGYEKYRIAIEFERAIIDPAAIASTMDDWYGKDITSYSMRGRLYGLEMGWDVLAPRYLEAFQCLLS